MSQERSHLLEEQVQLQAELQHKARARRLGGAFAAFTAAVVVGVAFLGTSRPYNFDTTLLEDEFPRTDERLIFVENFDGATVSTENWNIEKMLSGDGNGCFQFYTDAEENLYINQTDGTLRINPGLLFEDQPYINGVSAKNVMTGNCEPFPECATFQVPGCTEEDPNSFGCTKTGVYAQNGGELINPTTSAKITSQGKFSFQYGRLEVRMRLPAGDWLWPAFWLLPENPEYGEWPNSGEIDMLEAHGNAPGFQFLGNPSGRDRFSGCLHTAGNSFWTTLSIADANEIFGKGKDFSDDFFTLGLYWSKEKMYTYIRAEDADGTSTEHVLVDVPRGYADGFLAAPLGGPAEAAGLWQNAREAQPYDPDVYAGEPNDAPYNQPFYIIANLAVGGSAPGCPVPYYWGTDAIWCECYPNCARPPMAEFYALKDRWYNTWIEAGEKNAMAIDWIKVWQ